MHSSALAQHNQILASLSEPVLERLLPHLRAVALPVNTVLHEKHRHIKHVFFLVSGIASSVAGAEERRIEVGMTGQEGMTGLSLVLGVERSPHESVMQVAGNGLRLAAEEFMLAFEDEPELRKRTLLYASEFMGQIADTAVANGRCNVEERVARRLLLCQDRLADNVVPLTHEFLSSMLCVTRPGVTLALHTLRAAGSISTDRGRVTIVDRAKLVEIAGDAYSEPTATETTRSPAAFARTRDLAAMSLH